MAVLDVIVGYVRGLKGDTGETGATGATGPGATVSVGTVTTTTYGNPAQVTNSGTATDAVLNFVIPQGAPGEEVTDVSSLTLDSVTSTAASFPIPAVGEVMSVIMGKIIKFFGDTVTALNAKLNRSDVTTSLGVTTTGQALDATAGKTLNDSISALNDSLSNVPSLITDRLGSNIRTIDVYNGGTYTFNLGGTYSSLFFFGIHNSYAQVLLIENGVVHPLFNGGGASNLPTVSQSGKNMAITLRSGLNGVIIGTFNSYTYSPS